MKGASADCPRGLVRTEHGVLRERGAEAVSLGAQVDANPREQDHGDRAATVKSTSGLPHPTELGRLASVRKVAKGLHTAMSAA